MQGEKPIFWVFRKDKAVVRKMPFLPFHNFDKGKAKNVFIIPCVQYDYLFVHQRFIQLYGSHIFALNIFINMYSEVYHFFPKKNGLVFYTLYFGVKKCNLKWFEVYSRKNKPRGINQVDCTVRKNLQRKEKLFWQNLTFLFDHYWKEVAVVQHYFALHKTNAQWQWKTLRSWSVVNFFVLP